jgi:hypothetical protein
MRFDGHFVGSIGRWDEMSWDVINRKGESHNVRFWNRCSAADNAAGDSE